MGLQAVVSTGDNDTVFEVLKRVFRTSNKEQCSMIGLFCWSLWVRRNAWVWDRKNTSVFGVRSMALNLMTAWKRAQEADDNSKDKQKRIRRSWSKPPTDWVKINIDAACHPGEEFVGLSCVMRDSRGRFMRARSNKVRGRNQAREAEALSLKEALIWTKTWRNTKCIFETDAKLLVEAIYGTKGNSLFHTIVEDCVDLMKHFEEVLMVFDHRSANNVAHSIAQAAYSLSGLMEWHYTAPDFVMCNLISEEF